MYRFWIIGFTALALVFPVVILFLHFFSPPIETTQARGSNNINNSINSQPIFEYATKLQLDTSYMMKLVEIMDFKRKVIADNTGSHDSSILLSIQNLEYHFQLQFSQITTLETSKREAVKSENYDRAKQCKESIDELTNSLLVMV